MQSAAQSLTAGDMILRFAFTMKHAISLRPTNTGASLKNRKQSRPRSLQAAARNPPRPFTGKGLYHLSPRPSSRLSGWSSVLNRELRFRFFSFPTTPAGVFVGHNSRSRRRPRVAKQSRTVARFMEAVRLLLVRPRGLTRQRRDQPYANCLWLHNKHARECQV